MNPAMMNMSPESYFGGLTKAAKDLAAAEKRGGPIPAKFDFGVQVACAGCKQNILEPKKPLRCTACKSVMYCSKEVCLSSTDDMNRSYILLVRRARLEVPLHSKRSDP